MGSFMESQKIDPQLNMELEKSDGESVEVIIKYVGEIDDLNEYGIKKKRIENYIKKEK